MLFFLGEKVTAMIVSHREEEMNILQVISASQQDNEALVTKLQMRYGDAYL